MTNRITITLSEGTFTPDLQTAVAELVLRLARETGGIGLAFSTTDDEPAAETLPREARGSNHSNGSLRVIPPDEPAPANSHRSTPARSAKSARRAAKAPRAKAASSARRWSPAQLKKFQATMAAKREEKTPEDKAQGQPAQSDDGPHLAAAATLGQAEVRVIAPQPVVYLAAMNQLKTLSALNKLRRQGWEVAPVSASDD